MMWHWRGVDPSTATLAPDGRMTARLVGALHVEAMILADEVRGYFDGVGRAEREALDPLARIGFSCESLKATTRLMHVVAWLLTRRALDAGEISAGTAAVPARALGAAPASDPGSLAALPPTARDLVEATRDLYARVARLEQDIESPVAPASPARTLLSRLERAF